MTLQFKINKLALIRDIFEENRRNRGKTKNVAFSSWPNLENHLTKKFGNEPAYYLINPVYSDWAFKKIYLSVEKSEIRKTFAKVAESIELIYKEILKTKEFKKVFSETEEYKKFVEKQWNRNKSLVFDYFRKDLGFKIPDYKIAVYIFHPKSHNGQADYQTKVISWGHSEDWGNYTSVYLAHEILHMLTWDKVKNYDIMHALIELATDNELRIRLNEKGRYFQEGKYEIGHREIKGLERKILPHWKRFLNSSKKRNLFDLEKKLINRLT